MPEANKTHNISPQRMSLLARALAGDVFYHDEGANIRRLAVLKNRLLPLARSGEYTIATVPSLPQLRPIAETSASDIGWYSLENIQAISWQQVWQGHVVEIKAHLENSSRWNLSYNGPANMDCPTYSALVYVLPAINPMQGLIAHMQYAVPRAYRGEWQRHVRAWVESMVWAESLAAACELDAPLKIYLTHQVKRRVLTWELVNEGIHKLRNRLKDEYVLAA